MAKGIGNPASSIRDWLVSLFIKAVQAISTEQDHLDVIAWLTIARETLSQNDAGLAEKTRKIYQITDSRRVARSLLNSVSEVFKNYKDADLPLAVKVAIPATLGAGMVIGGHSVGIAGFGSAIGLPALLMVFLGVAGVTSVLEAFLSSTEASSYLSVVGALIARDEVLRRTHQSMRNAMSQEMAEPLQQPYAKDAQAVRQLLLNMDAYAFEQHVMSFFMQAGLLAWVTKRSNDAGVDGFARHQQGLIVVQCKRYAPENGVGRPTIQQMKGVVEENQAWCGYIVTTSYFTQEATSSGEKNPAIVLINLDTLVDWHFHGIRFDTVDTAA
jgi:restriction system protein